MTDIRDYLPLTPKEEKELRKKKIKEKSDNLSTMEVGLTGELEVAYKLSRNGFIPYFRLIDLDGVDLVVKNPYGDNKRNFDEIQVKKSRKYSDNCYRFQIRKSSFRPRFWYYLVLVCGDDLFIIPTMEFNRYILGKAEDDDNYWKFVVYSKNEIDYIKCVNGGNKQVSIRSYKNAYHKLK